MYFCMIVSKIEKVKERNLKDQENSTPQTVKIIEGLIYIHKSQKKSELSVHFLS